MKRFTWTMILCFVGGIVVGFFFDSILVILLLCLLWGAFAAPFLAERIASRPDCDFDIIED